MTTMSLRLPESIHRQLKALAERDGASMNHMATIAIAEKAALLLTVEYLERRAERGDRSRFEAALAVVPDVQPEERDRLPDSK